MQVNTTTTEGGCLCAAPLHVNRKGVREAAKADKQAATYHLNFPKNHATTEETMYTIENLIAVIRHEGAIEWIHKQGLRPVEIISHIDYVGQVVGKNVVGALPHHLAMRTRIFGRIMIPSLEGYNREEYTCQQMLDAGAYIEWYNVVRIKQEKILMPDGNGAWIPIPGFTEEKHG